MWRTKPEERPHCCPRNPTGGQRKRGGTESVETAAEEKEGDFCGKVPWEGGRVKERRVHVDLDQPCHGVASQLVKRPRAGREVWVTFQSKHG